MSWFSHSYKSDNHVLPEDTFFDALNTSSMDEQQMEGVLEQSLPLRVIVLIIGGIILLSCIVAIQLFRLQIVQGNGLYAQSEDNRLSEEIIFARRGVIFDREGVPLAWNQEGETRESFLHRAYISEPGFGHVLGYVKYPAKDRNGFYWLRSVTGQTGVESLLQDQLVGTNGALLVERDALMGASTHTSVREAKDGENIYTTLDSDLQTRVHANLAMIVEEDGYDAGAAVFMDIQTGDIRTLTNYPEYDSSIMSEGRDQKQIREFLRSPRGYFLNRVTAGLYSPGSTIKPFVALAGLTGDFIDENTTVYSTGRIEVPNRYDPENPAVFRDWRRSGHGLTDVQFAIADSVNTFFYALSGGYGDQDGMGIDYMSTFLRSFHIGQPTGFALASESTGVIPTPAWKQEIFNDDWRLGDTYITSIGQFGFQTTPLQMVRAVAALGNGGYLLTPRIIADAAIGQEEIKDIDQEDVKIVLSGMRQTVTRGTAQILKNIPVDMAVKTGTAQVSVRDGINTSWIVGVYPYENPETAFAVLLERGPNVGARSAAHVIYESFRIKEQATPPELTDESIEMEIGSETTEDATGDITLLENEL